MADPAYLASVALPDMAPPEVLERSRNGSEVVTRVLYRYTGSLESWAAKLIRADQLDWEQETSLDLERHEGLFVILPRSYGGLLSCSGAYRFEEEGDSTVRTTTGELVVRVPLVSARAERKVAGGMLRRMDAEADQLRRWLATPNSR